MIFTDDIKSLFSSLLNSYSDIFFIKGIVPGLIILSITLLNYNAGISGMLSILSAYTVARLLGYQSTFLSTGYFTYNALLVGLAIGYIFQISALSLLMVIIAGSLTMVITIVTSQVFYQLFGLQILSIPFIIVSILVYLSASSFTNLYVMGLYAQPYPLNLDVFPFWFSGYLKALGAIIFMPNEITGLLLGLLILISSRILFVLSVVGFSLGITIYGLFTGSIESAAQDISGFNYILIAMALGGVFNIPSLKSYGIALLGVSFATLIASAGHVFFSQYGLPVFTLPFTIVTLSFIYALGLLKYPLQTQVYIGTPEQNLEYYQTSKDRFVSTPAALSLPFRGKWHCWQGFDGDWTHKGAYRYAYDFVICDSQKKTYLNEGKQLTDYYCYAQEVLSPVRGRVIKVIHYLPDNSIGSVDTINNWGNEIIIEDSRGYIVKLAHFANQSIYVIEGQWVVVGTVLGLCGNSGHSPQPHIHIQIQTDYSEIAPTLPFVFVNYKQSGRFHSSGLPQVHANITHCEFDLYYDQVTNFILDEILTYDVYLKDEKTDSFSFQVKMSDLTSYYFETAGGKLYFSKQYGNFYFNGCEGKDPYLKMLFLALSTLPLSYAPKLTWSDTINNSLLLNNWQSSIANLLNSFYINWVSSHAEYHFDNETTVRGKISNRFFNFKLETTILLDPVKRFKEIRFGDYRLVQHTP
ncbi:Peptidase, M23/M37 family [hydrothermal vent metagenome]|uniref:Peptidase, M23/M37 family n=1 Tax=hydrothermal vent metagenome TaxID=652676 RepID=A0A3B0XYR3_9ZZZZ